MYKYTSMKYADEEYVKKMTDVKFNNGIIKYIDEKNKTHVHWSVDNCYDLIDGLKLIKPKNPVYLEFIPESFIEQLGKEGFVLSSEWKDFWINELNSLSTEKSDNVEEMSLDEVHHAYEITKSCEGLSNDFEEIPFEWFENWISEDEAFIFKLTVECDIVGILAGKFYGHDSRNGKVFWLRELAVRPEHQKKGYAKTLINHGLCNAKEKGARRSFLACDALNENAINLYRKFKYETDENRGQINMIKK